VTGALSQAGRSARKESLAELGHAGIGGQAYAIKDTQKKWLMNEVISKLSLAKLAKTAKVLVFF